MTYTREQRELLENDAHRVAHHAVVEMERIITSRSVYDGTYYYATAERVAAARAAADLLLAIRTR